MPTTMPTLKDLKAQVEELRERYPNLSADDRFTLWFLKAYVTDKEAAAAEAVCGHGGDKSSDAVFIDDNARCVFIVQAKYRESLDGKTEGRNDVMEFARYGAVLGNPDNAEFGEFLEDMDEYVAGRLKPARERVLKRGYRLWLYYVTLGKASTALRKEAMHTAGRAPCRTGMEVLTGKRVLFLLKDYLDGVAPPIPTLDLEMEAGSGVRVNGILQRYDHDTAIESWVFSMNGGAITELVESAGVRLFARNIRGFLGENTEVNRGMVATLETEPQHFFYYNNGITIICDEAEKLSSKGKDILRVGNPQVINGQQTTRTLAAHSENGHAASVLVKVIKVPRDSDGSTDHFDALISRIVACTNWQHPILPSDLVSNDRRQVEIERELRKLGYLYLRKRQSKGKAREAAGGKYYYTIKKGDLAQIVAACNLDPVVARSGKENLFEEDMYPVVFPNSDPNYYLPRYLLGTEVTYCAKDYPQRGYAKWLVLNFVWSHLSSLVRSGRGSATFRILCQEQARGLVNPLYYAINEAFIAAIRFYKRNAGRGAKAVDISLFFKNRRGLDKAFLGFWESAANKNRRKFQKYWNKVETALTEADMRA